MATRTFAATNTLSDTTGAPRKNWPVRFYLQTPGGLPVVNLEGAVLFNGQQIGEVDATTNNSGVYTVPALVFPGDLRTPAGAAVNCQIVADEGAGSVWVSPLTFNSAYAASVTVSAWYPTATAPANSLTMLLTADLVSNAPAQGVANLFLDITATALKPDGTWYLAGQRVAYTTDSSGNLLPTLQLVTSALLNPNTTSYILSLPGSTITFTVPAAPTGYQGTYAAGTTYNANAGTKASPADVVLYSGVYYQYINVTPAAGHQPDISPTYWKVWAGEPIGWNISLITTSGVIAAGANAVSANGTAPGSPVASPSTVQDVLWNLLYADAHGTGSSTAYAWVTKTANYTVLTTDSSILGDATAGAITITLPTAVASAQRVTIKKKDSSANAVNVSTTSAQTIDGSAPPAAITLQGNSLTFISDGASGWWIE